MTVEGGGVSGPVRPNFCTNCGSELMPSSNFCSRCGKPLAPAGPVYQPYVPPKSLGLRDVIMGLGTYSAIALFVFMAVNVVIALGAIGLVFENMNGVASLYVITPFIIRLVSFSGLPFFLYYVFLVMAILISFLWAIWKSARPLGHELRAKYPSTGHSAIYMVGTIFMAVLAFQLIYYFIVQGAGAAPTTPGFEQAALWEVIYSFAEASVWEEIVSRVLLIGVPLLILSYSLRSADGGGRKWYGYLLGGGFRIGRREAFFLAFSAIMFGMAHVFAWDLYKVLPATVAGLAFGYLFLKVGLFASIMLHFAFDFLSIPLSVFNNDETVALITGFALLIWVVVGVAYLLLYGSKGLGWLLGRPLWPEKPLASSTAAYGARYGYYQYPNYQTQTAYPPAPAGAGPSPPYPPPANYGRPADPTAFGFTCRNCGNREALYRDGQLICTRCGTKN